MADPDPAHPSIPLFAIVGHPNEGKSSVVATLAEDDSVRISDTPGETVARRDYPVRWNEEEILRFVDTPGFQHPQAMLEWMGPRAEPEGGNAPAGNVVSHRRRICSENRCTGHTPKP